MKFILEGYRDGNDKDAKASSVRNAPQEPLLLLFEDLNFAVDINEMKRLIKFAEELDKEEGRD